MFRGKVSMATPDKVPQNGAGADLHRLFHDIQTLNRHLSARTRHVFNWDSERKRSFLLAWFNIMDIPPLSTGPIPLMWQPSLPIAEFPIQMHQSGS